MPLRPITLDDRSFDQLVAETRARVPVHTPEWTHLDDSDPGITIVQLFAFMAENLLYRSNRVPEANRRKFLTLLGVPLQPAAPGRGLVIVRNERGPVEARILDAGTVVQAGKVPFRTRRSLSVLPVTAEVFFKQKQDNLDAATQELYRIQYGAVLAPTDQPQFYKPTPLEPPQIGKPPAVVDLASATQTSDNSLWVALVGPRNVPVDEVRRAIAGQTLTLGIAPAPQCEDGRELPPETANPDPVVNPGLTFEIAAPDLDALGNAAGGAKYERLSPEYAENVLAQPGIVELALPAEPRLRLWTYDPEEEGTGDFPPLVEDRQLRDRIATWIRIRYDRGTATGNASAARLSWTGANAARVVQAIAVVNERIGIGTGAPDQIYTVANRPVIADTESANGGFTLEIQDTAGAWERWQRTDDLFAARRDDKVFALDPESGQVSFGSGLRGLRPPLGRLIRASYEFGGGPAGVVPIGAINKAAGLPGGYKVENPLATWGGSEGEDVAAGERNIPRYLRHRDRAVTASDFQDLALRTPGVDVGRVDVLPLFHPREALAAGPLQTWPGVVTLMVIPESDPLHPEAPEPNCTFLQAVCDWLDPRRLLTTEVHVRGPIYVSIVVSVGIVTMPGHQRDVVRRAVKDALRTYLSPLTGGPPLEGPSPLDDVCGGGTNDPCRPARGHGWPLNTPVRRQDLEAQATRVTGVRYVDSIHIGLVPASGGIVGDPATLPMTGLQLPRATVYVQEGAAEDLGVLLGGQAVSPDIANLVSVPVLPKEC